LYPHMSVRQNIGYGLKVRRTPKAEAAQRIDDVAGLLGLDELLDRRPAELSGGQRQRVAMGRAIVREPQVFLMDEPLSNLDAKLRVGMRASLAQLHARLGTTTVYVTHDQTEAMTLGQRVAVLRDGLILQVDTPQHLYRDPVDVFVAAFIGTPAMNLVEAVIDGGEISFGGHRLPLDRSRQPAPAQGKVVLGIRPEAFAAAQPGTGLPMLEVTPVVVEELGADVHVLFPVAAAKAAPEDALADEESALLVQDEALLGARVDPRTDAAAGRPLTLSVDPSRFHFFDVESGHSLLPASGGVPADVPVEVASA